MPPRVTNATTHTPCALSQENGPWLSIRAERGNATRPEGIRLWAPHMAGLRRFRVVHRSPTSPCEKRLPILSGLASPLYLCTSEVVLYMFFLILPVEMWPMSKFCLEAFVKLVLARCLTNLCSYREALIDGFAQPLIVVVKVRINRSPMHGVALRKF
jgi:hypothetical protein